MTADTVTRAEFSMLRGMVTDLSARLDTIDQSGTRGVGALGVQIAEVIKDVATVSTDLARWRQEHELQHDREQAARVTGRRWLVATVIAAVVAVESPVLYLVAHVH